MSDFSAALSHALLLLVQLDSQLWEIIGLSLQVSLTAVTIATLIGLPLGAALATSRFPGHALLRVFVDSLMALPPVVVGLVVYLLLSRAGPLGVFGLLYTPTAMIIAQVVLITPLVIALSLQVFTPLWLRLGEQLQLLYVPRIRTITTLFQEGHRDLVTVLLAAFGRAIAEIGAVMMVGGNIDHHTRVMTTAIALETSKGNLELAMALGIVLMLMALSVNLGVHLLGRWRQEQV